MFNELIDIKEQKLLDIDKLLLDILLTDNTTKKNILWATDNYSEFGYGFSFKDEITYEKVTGKYKDIIKPRVKKTRAEKIQRIKEKAEVFTPSWVCNKQNNLVESNWFVNKNSFNFEEGETWRVNKEKVIFQDSESWKEYLEKKVLELSCGEAPFLVSRYDSVSGEIIELENRIGLLDRKFRVLNENVNEHDEWNTWSEKVIKSVFGYEWQGDNLLIARENILYTFIDNYRYKFNKKPDIKLVKNIAEIISWNLWQMDGIKYVIPDSCINDETGIEQFALFGYSDKTKKECIGCKKGNVNHHNGIYAKIMNWQTKKANRFINVLNKE